MEVEVPTPYLHYLRRQQIGWTVWRISLVLLIALLLIVLFPSFGVGGLTGGLGITLVPLGVLLLSGHSGIRYYLHAGGIGLTAPRFGPGLMTSAYQYAFLWRRDPLISMEYSHWEGSPALLLKTEKRPYGFLLPLTREDIEAVVAFLRPLVSVPAPRQSL